MTALDVVRLFDDVVLTENEEHVTQAASYHRAGGLNASPRLSPIEVRIFEKDRGGVFIKLSKTGNRIPIGSMGDGMWRMLGLALALANAKGGVLLVDEIDTGLHYSVMADMWRDGSANAPPP